MYCEFFGLSLPPFNNTPDPRFFFNTPDHEEALASLLYTAEQRKGFVLVTGEVGSGKTLLSRLLINRLNTRTRTAIITNTRLSRSELLLAICREFELDTDGRDTAAELTHILEVFLLEQYARDRLAVVILDEAQNLPIDTFEELRMLGNLEADDANLLQVLILGQPELQETFRQPSMKQSYQRIFRAFHLGALNAEMTAGYINHRLSVAGQSAEQSLFEPAAIEAIFKHSRGIPRLINQICDNALLSAYGDSENRVTARRVEEVMDQMMSLNAVSEASPPPKTPRPDRVVTSGMDPSTLSKTNELVSFQAASEEPPRPRPASNVDKRLEAMEAELDQLRRQDQMLRLELQNRQIDFESARQLQQKAMQLVQKCTDRTREADQQMRELLGKSSRIAESIESREKSDIDSAQKASVLQQEQTQRAENQAKIISERQQLAINRMIEQGQAEMKAIRHLRQQATDVYKTLTHAQHHSEQRLSKVIDETGDLCKKLEQKAETVLSETQEQTHSLQKQLAKLIDETRTKAEADRAQAARLSSQQRSDLDAARNYFESFNAQLKEQASRYDHQHQELQAHLKNQVETLVSQIKETQDQTRLGAEQTHTQLDSFVKEMQARIQGSQGKIMEVVSTAENEVQTACAELRATKQQIIDEAEERRKHADESLEQTRKLLADTKSQCASLLGNLRHQISEQSQKAEMVWQANVQQGTQSLSELNARLNETRKLTDQSRSELESLVHDAAYELSKARQSLDSSLETQRKDITGFAQKAEGIKTEFLRKFEEAKSALDDMIGKHREGTVTKLATLVSKTNDQLTRAESHAQARAETLKNEINTALISHDENAQLRVSKMALEINRRIAEAESGAEKRVESLKDTLAEVSIGAEQVCKELRESVEMVRQNAVECQAQFKLESDTIQKHLTHLMQRNQASLNHTRTEVEDLSHKARATAATMKTQIENIKKAGQSHLSQISHGLDAVLAEAISKADAIQKESESMASQLAERMAKSREEDSKAVSRSENATKTIRLQSKRSLAEVRACLAQMIERSNVLHHDLSQMGDDIVQASQATIEQLHKTGVRVTAQIEAMRENAQRDADANYKRLGSLKQQIERSAEQMRHNASKLLDQVQSGIGTLRQHADTLIQQAQNGSDRLNETASNLLAEAQSSAEQFRQKAEELLTRSEATAGRVHQEVEHFHAQVSGKAEQIGQQVDIVKNDLADARRQATESVTQTQQQAQTNASHILKKASVIQQQSERLLSMPKEIVDEAKRQAQALSKMSNQITTVVKQLAAAGKAAQENKQTLEQAGDVADEKVDLLKRHTERVGQLVGIIRQLYGTMDARIERLRGRLTKVDDLVRAVPQEIQNLRAVFESDDLTEELKEDRTASGHKRARDITERRIDSDRTSQSSGGVSKHQRDTAATSPAQKNIKPNKVTTPVSYSQAGSLGEIVQRNQKLNDWLRDMLGDDALKGNIQPVNHRASNKPTAKV